MNYQQDEKANTMQATPDASTTVSGPTATTSKPRWIGHPAIVIPCLLLFPPLGIALVWVGRRWPTAVKWSVTALTVVYFFVLSAVGQPPKPAVTLPSPSPSPTVPVATITPTIAPSTPPPAAVTPAPATAALPDASTQGLRIAVTLDQLKGAMPLLAQIPMKTIPRDGGAQYTFDNIPSMSSNDLVTAFDDHNSGTLDEIIVTVQVDQADNDMNNKGFILLNRVLQVAGTPAEPPEESLRWLIDNFTKSGASRRFGSVLAKLAFIPGQGGGVLVMTLNEPLGH